ncbi:DUF3613 domain-containing protein [Paracandidimonas soli]|uniref:Uncharacterized protein DUF3613 n=1 Tax=Paracandidimonas soli TaxID=1917182 RepID=A0A4R3V9H8_9BURK|nr:DUF3613 domain-containing protein [Paracandidimonas soli]TCV00631.1 uncharacterized protein DUF3613 [Paracandidimonas soli]
MQEMKHWHRWCLAGLAGLAMSASVSAQQNARLTDRPAAMPAQANSAASPPAAVQSTGHPAALQIEADAGRAEAPSRSVRDTPASTAGVSAWWDVTPIGAETRALMAAQAAGTQAAPALPTLGVTASEAWDRYLESFRHPVPEWFKQHVDAVDKR